MDSFTYKKKWVHSLSQKSRLKEAHTDQHRCSLNYTA